MAPFIAETASSAGAMNAAYGTACPFTSTPSTNWPSP